jgi:tetratricopeptide (TPR) repeat protein
MKHGGPHAHGRVTLTILFLLAVIVNCWAAPVFGEVKTVTHTVRQPFGGSQSPDDARIAAVARAKREALEMAGTYVEALTVVKNSRVEKDEILALTAGVVKAEIVSQKNYHTKDAFGVEVKVKVKVDTALLEGRVRKLLSDRTHLDQLKDSGVREKELLDRLARLEEENGRLRTGKDSAMLKEQFQETSRGLTAVELAMRAFDLYVDGRYSDPRKALGYLDQALRLKPDYAWAYNGRGEAYRNLKDYPRAIQDYTQAIRLNPDIALAYSNRGEAYRNLKDYPRAMEDYTQAIRLEPHLAEAYLNRGAAYVDLEDYSRAIQDCDQAIRLKPDYAEVYINRGAAYLGLKNYSRAIQDLDRAIRLEPHLAEAYLNRGAAYVALEDYSRAIQDCDQAIRLEPDLAEAYLNRGNGYLGLKDYSRAIQDLDRAIRLKPNYAEAYNNRGLAYLLLGNRVHGCSDAQKACELGHCKAYELAKRTGGCL